jgi:hypothetical protein
MLLTLRPLIARLLRESDTLVGLSNLLMWTEVSGDMDAPLLDASLLDASLLDAPLLDALLARLERAAISSSWRDTTPARPPLPRASSSLRLVLAWFT